MTVREKTIGASEAGKIKNEGGQKLRERGIEGGHAERKGGMGAVWQGWERNGGWSSK